MLHGDVSARYQGKRRRHRSVQLTRLVHGRPKVLKCQFGLAQCFADLSPLMEKHVDGRTGRAEMDRALRESHCLFGSLVALFPASAVGLRQPQRA